MVMHPIGLHRGCLSHAQALGVHQVANGPHIDALPMLIKSRSVDPGAAVCFLATITDLALIRVFVAHILLERIGQ
jgi:hypothetical protein